MLKTFDPQELKKLYTPAPESSGEQNGQVTIIGGSSLFHGAPLLSLKVASRIVDMVFFSSPEPGVGKVTEAIKSKLFSFIWVPWEDAHAYIEKSDAVLIGPGLMRYKSDKKEVISDKKYDKTGEFTREISKRFLSKFKSKKWVIDAGSLQVMDSEWIPRNSVLTPNQKEFEMLFGVKGQDGKKVKENAERYNCIINSKGPTSFVCSPKECVEIPGGNPGLTKGGTGDVLAGLTVALLAKNDPFLAAAAAAYITKASADELFERVGTFYNADDLAEEIPSTLFKLAAIK